MFMRATRSLLLAGAAAVLPAQLAAQETAPTSDPAAVAPPQATAAGDRRVYTPADFARFAPKSAYDMLAQVPGFSIRGSSSERGLGQASENVLINGQRITDKSASATSQLQNVPAAQVERIEIVDASSLGIAGLTGAVANVVVKASEAKKGSGNFQWRPEVRAHYADPNWFRGKVSYNDVAGPFDYTLTIDNQANRGAFGEGLFETRYADGLVENRDMVLKSNFTQTRFIARTKIDLPGSSIANLSVNYGPYWYDFSDKARVTRSDGDNRDRLVIQEQDGFMIDFNGDVEFPVGPGRMKLIGLRHYEHEPTLTTLTAAFDSGEPDEGVRFGRDAHIGETVARAEYKWKSGKNDWELSLERAYNSLRQNGQLFFLSPDGEFEETPYPQGSGEVREIRYEGIASLSRALSPKLDLQLAGGGEISKLERVDGDLEPRRFFRPKGSVILGWRPSKGWDASLSLKRRVGQISFYDFLAQPNLNQDRENAGNDELVPPQSWELEGEVGRDLGAWGKTRLKLFGHRIDDIIDIVPIGEDGESVGNLPRATRWGAQWTSTFQFDPIGWKGAKLDLSLFKTNTSVRDPLTGEKRPISGNDRYGYEAALRHDIAGSKLAWGASWEKQRSYNSTFLTEIGNGWEGPFSNVFVEHKDVMGLKVRFDVSNLNGGKHYFWRDVYEGRRDVSPIAFRERQAEKIGPIFRLDVRGNF